MFLCSRVLLTEGLLPATPTAVEMNCLPLKIFSFLCLLLILLMLKIYECFYLPLILTLDRVGLLFLTPCKCHCQVNDLVSSCAEEEND